jgi:SOS-response transcriptional repressor LexA
MSKIHWTVRLVEAFDALVPAGMTPEKLSRESGVGLKSVYKYLQAGRRGGQGTTNPHKDTVKRLADVLGTTEQHLRFGNAEPPVVGLKKVPLLRMNEMGTLKKGQDVREVWDGASYVAAPSSVSNQAFGIEVTDVANESRVHLGDIIILEPTADPQPGNFVVAVVEGHKHALLRRYRALDPLDPTVFMLMAENPDFPAVTVDSDHPGFVVGKAVKRITDI